MSTVLEWIGRTPEIPFTRRPAEISIPISRLLADAGWIALTVMLGFFTWFVLGDAAVFVGQVAVDGVAGVAGVALWQTVLSVLVVAVPLGFAALVGHHVRRDAGSMALAAAAMTATVLIAGMAEIGIAALLVLSLGS